MTMNMAEEKREVIAIPTVNGIPISGFFDFIYDGTDAEVSFVLLPENLSILEILNTSDSAFLDVKFGENGEVKSLIYDGRASIIGLDCENGRHTIIKVKIRGTVGRNDGMLTADSFRKVGEAL